MRVIEITEECLRFIDESDKRVSLKFFQLIEVIGEVKNLSSHFVKKLQSTKFYELRIKAGNEYRVVLFAVDHLNFNECKKVVCLCGFHKKATKDYKKALKQAEVILKDYIENSEL